MFTSVYISNILYLLIDYYLIRIGMIFNESTCITILLQNNIYIAK